MRYIRLVICIVLVAALHFGGSICRDLTEIPQCRGSKVMGETFAGQNGNFSRTFPEDYTPIQLHGYELEQMYCTETSFREFYYTISNRYSTFQSMANVMLCMLILFNLAHLLVLLIEVTPRNEEEGNEFCEGFASMLLLVAECMTYIAQLSATIYFRLEWKEHWSHGFGDRPVFFFCIVVLYVLSMFFFAFDVFLHMLPLKKLQARIVNEGASERRNGKRTYVVHDRPSHIRVASASTLGSAKFSSAC